MKIIKVEITPEEKTNLMINISSFGLIYISFLVSLLVLERLEFTAEIKALLLALISLFYIKKS